jgi:hypothetical protein
MYGLNRDSLMSLEDRLLPNQIIVPSEVFISPPKLAFILNGFLISYNFLNVSVPHHVCVVVGIFAPEL